jgi:SecD/SecF fusion protein
MPKIPLWKPLLIVVVLAVCGLSIYPPSQRLKLGLDLAGGTILVYQVDVPADQDAPAVLEQTMASLKKRVDPNGVRNLIWRQQAGNRIEIQMPLAPAETGRRRAEYLAQRDALLKSNIKKSDLDSAMRASPDDRPAALDRLAGGNAGLRGLLDAMAQAHDAAAAARGPYEQAQQQKQAAEAAWRDLPADAPVQERNPLEERLKSLEAELIAKTRLYVDARKALEAAEGRVLASNIDATVLENILNLPDQPVKNAAGREAAGPPLTERQGGLNKLIEQHPDRAEQLQAVAKAKAAYDQVRGPLDDPNDLIALLRGSGVLEFRIAATAGALPDEADYREQLRERGPRAGQSKPYRWFVIDDIKSFAEKPREREALEATPEEYFAQRGLIGQAHGGEYYVLLANTPGLSLTQGQEGWRLSNAFAAADANGFAAVGFELNRIGGQLMGELTGNNIGQPMAIVLDGRVISTPSIRDRIQDHGIITGGSSGFSQEEQSYLIRTLNAGSLQGRLSENPIYIKKFGPQLGQDNLHHGLAAAVWSLIVVSGFMAAYYLFGGLVADFALAANMVLILGAMAMFDATFTLPGIAGVVLTIGMAVDANVLIFERIREELERKVEVATAVRLGYEKALSSILDSNITTLITCVILNYTATAEIKGFAITLMIGLTASMFTAVFCTRVIFEIYLRLAPAKTLHMLPTLVPSIRRRLQPNVDWIRWSPRFLVVSGVAIVMGLAGLFLRGGEMLDIEFRGGTQVSFALAEGTALSLDQVRQRLNQAAEQAGLPQLRGDRATVVTVGQTEGMQAREFSIATLETDAAAVSNAIKAAFADVLDVQRPIAFTGMGAHEEAPDLRDAPVYPIHQSNLGESINRPEVRVDVSDYVGGVAVVLEGMDPAPTVEELTQRIERTRLQPEYEALGYRPFAVIGLELATGAPAPGTPGTPGTGGGGAPRYRGAVVVAGEAGTSYLETPDTFNDKGGLAETQWRLVHDALRRDTSLAGVSNFSSQVSSTMRQQAVVAMVLSLLAIVAYIWFRFGNVNWGLAAIVALVHDVTIALGAVAVVGWLYETPIGHGLLLSDFKINLALLAAMLTLVGYSLNDTIIVFDRIRENRGRLPDVTAKIINDAINQTVSRTIITSGTTLIAVVILYLLGGDGVHGFAFAMLVGVVVGTYSSIAIASPILLIGRSKSPAAAAKAAVPVGGSGGSGGSASVTPQGRATL